MTSQSPDEFTRAGLRFTLKQLFLGDTILNWFLGSVLIAFPGVVDRLLAAVPPLMPPLIYRVIGVIFLLFAAWQTVIEVRQRMGPPALVFACLMAEGPVVLLTIALLFMDLALKPAWRAILWVGDVYMLLLGAWYLFLAVRLSRSAGRAMP